VAKEQSIDTPPPKVRTVALIVASTMFMSQLDGAVLATALPDIGADFGVSPIRLSLSITIYLMALVALLPASGWIAERFGARNVFLIAIAIFTGASVLCAASTSYWAFIGARVIQGAGASLMTPVGRLVLLRTTPKSELVAAMTISTMPMLLAPTFGPPLGGFIVTYMSWPWIFLLNVPIAVVAMLCIWRMIPDLREAEQRPLDLIGLLLLSGALLGLLAGLDQLAAPGGMALGVALLAGGVVASFFSLRHLSGHPHAIVPLDALHDATFRLVTVGGGALARLPLRALPFLLPLFFQLGLGMNALAAGSMLIALNGGDLLFKPVAGGSFRRYGFRAVLVVTALIGALTVFACGAFGPATSVTLMLAVLVISGMARSLLFTGISTLAFSELEERDLGSANVVVNIAQQVSNAVAVSLSALLLHIGPWLSGGTGEATVGDFRLALFAMGAIGLAAVFSLMRLSPHAGAEASGHVVDRAERMDE